MISPPPVAALTDMAEMFNGASEKSRRFSEHYGRFAEQYWCEYFDADEHRKLGEAITARVEEVFQ